MNIRSFFRRHFIWVGLCAVIIPLLINLYLQYVSLARLEETLPAARKVVIERRLNMIASDVQEHYRALAQKTLDVPPGIFAGWANEEDFEAVDRVVENYFNPQPATGVKRFFLISVYRESRRTVLGLYDPATRKVESGNPSREGLAVFVATSPWITLLWQEARGVRHDSRPDPEALILDEKDPENRIMLKPVTDGMSRLVGIAGLIIDMNYFKNTYLPEALWEAYKKHFSDAELGDLVLTVYDGGGSLIASTHPVGDHDAKVMTPLQFAFSNWLLGVHLRGPTHEQLARRQFIFSFSLAAMSTVVLVVAIGLALRTADRDLKLSQMKTDFVSNVSHELRTPLSSIRVFGEFQRLGWVTDQEKVRQYGEYIEAESRRLTQLINNILDFSRIESGQKCYHFERGQLEEVISETLKMFEVRLQQSGFTIMVEAAPHPLPTVILDPEAISQVLVNLLDNAMKYSGKSTHLVVRQGQADGYVTFSVKDYGVGIPPEEQHRIFERFHRVSTGLVHDVKGSGLGLSLVKHITEAHGGKVTVDSEPGHGSTFTVHLPLAEAGHEKREVEDSRPVEQVEGFDLARKD
jgi:signal transduction histidine kinase